MQSTLTVQENITTGPDYLVDIKIWKINVERVSEVTVDRREIEFNDSSGRH